MGARNGTGQPYWLKCAKCRLSLRARPNGGRNLEATGKIRPLNKSQIGRGGRRVLQHQVQYRCLDCKHEGWTRHIDAEHLLKKRHAQNRDT